MFAIYKREIINFLSSTIGYLVLLMFLVVNSLFLWFLDGDFNILSNGYASLDEFFKITPWFLIVIISSISMGMISEEKKQGTFDLLITHPIKLSSIILAKFYAVLSLVIISLLPTVIYVYSIYSISLPVGNIDLGAIFSSYLGLVLLASVFSIVGIFSSVISNNQVTSFLFSILISVFIYYGFQLVSTLELSLNSSLFIGEFGLFYRYQHLSKGVVGLSDLIYIFSLLFAFGLSSVFILGKSSKGNFKVKTLIYSLIALLIINLIADNFVNRLDFTTDKRFTLNTESIAIVKELKSDISVQVLLNGDLPYGFIQLEQEVKRVLTDLRVHSSNIYFNFNDPIEGLSSSKKNKTIEELSKRGITPINLEVNKGGERKSKYIFPWIIIRKGDKFVTVNILKNKIGSSPEQQINNSIENIEFAIIDGIRKLELDHKPKVAILKGNDELADMYLTSFLNDQHEYYNFEKIRLNGKTSTSELSKILEGYKALLIIKPSTAFSEPEKLLIDQYIVGGGNTLWMLDGVFADMDSLMANGSIMAFKRNLNLDEMLFKYGFRVNSDIVMDLQNAPIKLASGNMGDNVQYHTVSWPFFPLSIPVDLNKSANPIVKNIEAVRFKFTSSIDTILSKGIKKTVLMKSSVNSKIMGTPAIVDFSGINKIDNNSFKEHNLILGLLLEGRFTSAYKNRLLPFNKENFKEQNKASKMIVFSDGDLIANDFQNGAPLPIGYDKWFNKQYGNNELISNSLNYLIYGDEILKLKKKHVTLRLLDKNKVKIERTKWQLINVFSPIIFVIIIGLFSFIIRRNKYKN